MDSSIFSSAHRRKVITSAYPNVFTDLDFYTAEFICRVTSLSNPDHHIMLYDTTLVLSKAIRSGNVAIPASAIDGQSLVEIMHELFGEVAGATDMITAIDIHAIGKIADNSSEHPLVLDGGWLYFRRYWLAEQEILRFVSDSRSRISISSESPVDSELSAFVDEVLHDGEGRTSKQIEAVKKSLRHQFSIITGGPGTGKTRTVLTLASTILKQNPQTRVALIAPTGKAAQRMVESIQSTKKQMSGISDELLSRIPEHGKTIHRLLGWNPGMGRFKNNSENQLDFDLIILDEASMVDLPMIARLIRAIPHDCRLIMLGDRNQLASVEAGAVFADLATSNFDEIITELTYSWRFGPDSDIGVMAAMVNAGEVSGSLEYVRSRDMIRPMRDISKDLLREVRDHYHRLKSLVIDPTEEQLDTAFEVLQEHQILTAYRTGIHGCESLGFYFDTELISANRSVKPRGPNQSNWYVARPILVEQNDYDLGLFNGDIGITVELNGTLFVTFGRDADTGEYKYFNPGQLSNVSSAWAITVHKSQGSEYRNVSVILSDEPSPIVTRELLYTAITRARTKATIYTSDEVWQRGVEQRSERRSGLRDKLICF